MNLDEQPMQREPLLMETWTSLLDAAKENETHRDDVLCLCAFICASALHQIAHDVQKITRQMTEERHR